MKACSKPLLMTAIEQRSTGSASKAHVVGAGQLLLPVLGGLVLVDAGPVVGRIPPERDVQVLQERVHACSTGTLAFNCWSVTVLAEACRLSAQENLNHSCSPETHTMPAAWYPCIQQSERGVLEQIHLALVSQNDGAAEEMHA
jgi:hypothetical protein